MTLWWALCRREWLEHRVALGWAPAGLLGLFLLAIVLVRLTMDPPAEMTHGMPWQPVFRGIAEPFIWIYIGAAVLILLSSLMSERKERTILFWKSMPVTDTQTVLSKLFVVCGVGSAISIIAIILAQLCVVLVAGSLDLQDTNANGTSIWAQAQWPTSAVNWISGHLSQIFWLFPLWGWLLFVSSLARSMPMFWAIAVPVALTSMEWVLWRSDHLLTNISNHLDLRALPSRLAAYNNQKNDDGNPLLESSPYLSQLAELWGSTSMWLGIVTGCLFIIAAIFFRHRNNEF